MLRIELITNIPYDSNRLTDGAWGIPLLFACPLFCQSAVRIKK